jgi:hypothetical protein
MLSNGIFVVFLVCVVENYYYEALERILGTREGPWPTCLKSRANIEARPPKVPADSQPYIISRKSLLAAP